MQSGVALVDVAGADRVDGADGESGVTEIGGQAVAEGADLQRGSPSAQEGMSAVGPPP